MAKLVNLVIEGKDVQAPEGMLIVNAAKKAGVYIPVFCYHPKMEPVGMCRMCLVEIGRPVVNRETGQLERNEDGSAKIQFTGKLETACTVPVAEGIVVRSFSENALRGRKDIIEFLLTSHPLDCPICDKGGECPLQNLTMDFGPGKSRFIYDEKKRLAKHHPLGELIVLDRERCIQCGRCVRFQDNIADDPVIGFAQRGRALQIITYSEPGFDSYFSGNTTDICPVGALTTTDFRFEARPWELKAAASICQQCPVGCNLTLNIRRENRAGGKFTIKRVMPRQNETVNEIWICDKGRFAYHYAGARERLTQPLVRKGEDLVAASWDECLALIADHFREAGEGLVTLASGRLANEDLFNLRRLTEGLGGNAIQYTEMAGGDLVAQVGVGQGTNFSDMGKGTAILVVACDLQEEAPIYWLRVKQAADRGATLIVVNPRRTKLDRYAAHSLRYPYGSEAAIVLAMLNALSAKRPELPEDVRRQARAADIEAAAQAFAGAENAVILFGSEGTGLAASQALAQACANLLIATAHTGRPNNGLIGVWERANGQGAWDMGFQPVDDLAARLRGASALYVAGANPAGDSLALAEALKAAAFLVVQDLSLTETALLADVVLPAQSFVEREGSLTNGERRVQRYYPGLPPGSEVLPDFAITARIAGQLGIDLESRSAARIMERIAAQIPEYAGLSYLKLAEVTEQWPIVGRGDLYYGGTTYENTQGLGVQLQPAAQRGEAISLAWQPPSVAPNLPEDQLLAVPITRLYDRGETVWPSHDLIHRIPEPYAAMNPASAAPLGLIHGAPVHLKVGDTSYPVMLWVDADVPEGVVLVPRSLGVPISGPVPIQIAAAEQVAA